MKLIQCFRDGFLSAIADDADLVAEYQEIYGSVNKINGTAFKLGFRLNPRSWFRD